MAEKEEAVPEGVRDWLAEKFGTLSIHGGAVGYYQACNKVTIGGEDFDKANGFVDMWETLRWHLSP